MAQELLSFLLPATLCPPSQLSLSVAAAIRFPNFIGVGGVELAQSRTQYGRSRPLQQHSEPPASHSYFWWVGGRPSVLAGGVLR